MIFPILRSSGCATWRWSHFGGGHSLCCEQCCTRVSGQEALHCGVSGTVGHVWVHHLWRSDVSKASLAAIARFASYLAPLSVGVFWKTRAWFLLTGGTIDSVSLAQAKQHNSGIHHCFVYHCARVSCFVLASSPFLSLPSPPLPLPFPSPPPSPLPSTPLLSLPLQFVILLVL